MNKWYKTNLAKTILILLAIIMPMVAVLSLATLYNASSLSDSMLSNRKRNYEESVAFESLLQAATSQTVSYLKAKLELEKDGKYDPNQKVDIKNLYDNGSFYNEKESSGLVYTVDQLANWGDDWKNDSDGDSEETIIVCQRSDGTYYYYYLSDFKELLETKKLRLELDDNHTGTFLEDLQNGYYGSDYREDNTVIKDENEETVYTACWTFEAARNGKFAPEGYDSLLDAINHNQELNGKLSNIYEWLEEAGQLMADERANYENPSEQWTEGNTNYKYLYLNAEKKLVYTNNSVWSDYGKAESLLAGLEDTEAKKPENLKYIIVRATRGNFVTNIDRELEIDVWQDLRNTMPVGKEDAFLVAVDTDYPIQDIFQENMKAYRQYQPYVGICKAGLVLSVLCFIACIVWLTWIAGRNACGEGLSLNNFDNWKTEIAAGLVIGAWILWTVVDATFWSFSRRDTFISSDYAGGVLTYYTNVLSEAEIFILMLYAGGVAILFIIGYLSLVRRIKGRILWKNSLLRLFCVGVKKVGKGIALFWKGRKMIWRTLLVCVGLFFLNLFGMNMGSGVFVLLMLTGDIYVCYSLCRKAMAEDKIRTGLRRIAGGDVDYKIPVQGLKGEELETAEAVNSIGEGMNVALENSMKSERLKTDLITNVSHDIKTPLTSIINYVELLKQENLEDPKSQRYLEILEEKSQRLKTLTEDVVEASKVSSGNINLEYSNLNFVEMIQQTSGEFVEKFEAKQLTEVRNIPENAVVIRVDGRRLWRVLSNIYNNAAKYAMPNTRIYADLQVIDGTAVFSLKNISEQPLNISANELTERFIRGDVSRSTEGSGLGLSIAESLTKMQGGTFGLYLDGDLFKVTISFPLV